MIALVTGPPGAGKSFYAIRKSIEAVESGKYLVANFSLVDDWERTVANHHPLRWMMPGRRAQLRKRFEQRSYFSEDLDELARVRAPGNKEGRIVGVIDELGSFLNARSWQDEDRDRHVKFFKQHRKVGMDLYVLDQDEKTVDRQVRVLAEYVVALRNLKRMKVVGVPVSPVNLFLAVWRWHGTSRSVVKREIFTLDYRRKLYDTHGTAFGFEKAPDDAIWLPRTLERGDGGREREQPA